jgi:sulfite reductase beta subunit-like hemoprotein
MMNEKASGDKSGGGVLPVKREEIDLLKAEMERLDRQEITPEGFRSVRVKQGVYGQRQPDQQMIRIKIPFGGLTADQLEALAEIAERHSSSGLAHVTTRQNVQVHFVRLEQVPQVLRTLAAVGLTTRESGGNQVRNVTACALAGVCSKEVFDVTPYAAAFARYYLRNPLCNELPRKFKIAFSGCNEDCALGSINDLGFVAAVESDEGAQRQGFRIDVGGGLSTLPRHGLRLYDFVPAEESLAVSQAVVQVFDRLGERRNRNRARLKFLLARLGLEEFRQLVEEESKGAGWSPELASLINLGAEGPGEPRTVSPVWESDVGFSRWRASNVVAQRQDGYCAAFVTLPLGDASADQLRSLATIAREFAGGRARTTVEQDLVLRWVREEALLEAGVQSNIGSDITACPGTDSCSLAITSSRGLAQAISGKLNDLDWRQPNGPRISMKVSGCPSSCGQHHLGNIGLHGASTHHYGLQVPSCELYLGGDVSSEGVRLGTRVTRIIAKKAPEAIVALLELYDREKQSDEGFVAFVDRFGSKEIERAMAPFKTLGPPEEEPECYRDWGATKLFVVERGEGECAA